jgi:Domain of unknown function (DUF5753)
MDSWNESTHGSALVRKLLGMRLQEARMAAGKKVGDVVEAGIASRAKLYRLEAGDGPYRWVEMQAFGSLYALSQNEIDTLIKLAKASNGKNWTEGYEVPEHLAIYADLETSASSLMTWDPELVHGLLQTEEYIAALMQSTGKFDDKQVKSRVEFRLERQRLVFAEGRGAKMRCILGESALRCRVGSPRTTAAQIRHLIELGNRVDVVYRPHSAGPHEYMKGPFAIMGFPEGAIPSTVYMETQVDVRYLETPRQVEQWTEAFELLYAQSLPIERFRP